MDCGRARIISRSNRQKPLCFVRWKCLKPFICSCWLGTNARYWSRDWNWDGQALATWSWPSQRMMTAWSEVSNWLTIKTYRNLSFIMNPKTLILQKRMYQKLKSYEQSLVHILSQFLKTLTDILSTIRSLLIRMTGHSTTTNHSRYPSSEEMLNLWGLSFYRLW